MRPRIKLTPTRSDRIADLACWLALAALWILVLVRYPGLPEEIPVHYNISGAADRFGHKANLFTLPAVGTFLVLAMTVLNRYPHIFNYPVTITPGNAYRQYTGATRLIRYMKLTIVVAFGLLIDRTVRVANSGDETGFPWFVVLMAGLLAAPVIVWMVSALAGGRRSAGSRGTPDK